MTETPWQIQQREKLARLKGKQDAGQASAEDEAKVHHPAFKKKKKKKKTSG